MAFGTFFELMSRPRGIAAAVDAKNMPPAYFLNAPTVLQEIIYLSYWTTKSQKSKQLLGFLFATTSLFSNTALQIKTRFDKILLIF